MRLSRNIDTPSPAMGQPIRLRKDVAGQQNAARYRRDEYPPQGRKFSTPWHASCLLTEAQIEWQESSGYDVPAGNTRNRAVADGSSSRRS